jgi:hypothetical protein
MTARAFACQYAGMANGRRYEMWREEFARMWLSIDFKPVTGNSIANEIRCSEHSFLALCEMRGTPCTWSEEPIRPRTHTATDI